MPSTTNFGWTTPADTDLVKDGAAAIRTLGNGIDTSFLDLKGGTTNQILAKNSNTDLDFKWVSDATGMTNPMTTTGDIIYSSSGSTPARLGIGSTGQVLTVSGGVPAWAAASSTNDYALLNSGGTALTGATTITVNITAHNKLALRYEGTTTNGSSYIQLRFNSDSGANYYFSGLKLTGTTAGRDGSFGGNEFNMGRMGNNAVNVVYTIAMVEGAKGTGYKPFYAYGNADGSTTNESFSYGGLYAGSSAITSISLISTSGNFDGGTLYIYGAN